MTTMLDEIDGVTCPLPGGRLLLLPVGEGPARTPAPRRDDHVLGQLAGLILAEAEVAVVPGEAFGTPGYLRLSYALGDDDLVEGVGRMQKLLAETTG